MQSMTDLFDFKSNSEGNDTAPRKSESGPPKSNVPEFTVGDLAFSLKRTLEENYSRVRVRGEFSRITIAASGHLYSQLKDDQALIDVVCWKGTLNTLSVKPEEGLEVICTGSITSYPKSSKYQLKIESIELAGEGALLKMLEERRKKLAAEGLFEEGRKKRLPLLPDVIGVVTSPTGAVIRDILHRLEDRFPRHVLVWPVLVQGNGAAEQVAAAIRGFDALGAGGAVPRPDLVIVARGGGSLEDLMPFNEEVVVRSIAACRIPIISAIGHETDTTLADFAADYRAPTPTGAAEMAVPRRHDLLAQVLEDEKRLLNGVNRLLSEGRHKLEARAARLGDPVRLLENRMQGLDMAAQRLGRSFDAFLSVKQTALERSYLRLRHPSQLLEERRQRLEYLGRSLDQGFKAFVQKKETVLQRGVAKLPVPRHAIEKAAQRLETRAEQLVGIGNVLTRRPEEQMQSAARLLQSLSYGETLKRGYVVVRDMDGKPVTEPDRIENGQEMQLEFAQERRVRVKGV